MELRNCSKCGKLFMFVSKRVCPDCQKAEEEEFNRIRAYIKAHPGATMVEICDALEVDHSLVEEFVRQGRSEVVVSGLALVCDRCGKEIRIGRYCESCLGELDQELRDRRAPGDSAFGQRRERPRMYTSGSLLGDDKDRRK